MSLKPNLEEFTEGELWARMNVADQRITESYNMLSGSWGMEAFYREAIGSDRDWWQQEASRVRAEISRRMRAAQEA